LSVAEVTKTRSATTIGEDQPSPGIAVFQATFSVSLHRSGSLVSIESPWPLGPRHPRQSCPYTFDREKVEEATARENSK
jgi:hypothetical protein